MSSLKVKYNDKSLRQLKDKLKWVQVKVGLPKGTPNADNGESIIMIGAVNEFGSPSKGIPERSFIRSTINESVEEYKKVSKEQAVLFLEGKQNIDTMTEKIGMWGQGKIKKKFKNNNWKPNSDITINGGWITRNGKSFFVKGKKNSKPLIDTGQLVQSITWEVAK